MRVRAVLGRWTSVFVAVMRCCGRWYMAHYTTMSGGNQGWINGRDATRKPPSYQDNGSV